MGWRADSSPTTGPLRTNLWDLSRWENDSFAILLFWSLCLLMRATTRHKAVCPLSLKYVFVCVTVRVASSRRRAPGGVCDRGYTVNGRGIDTQYMGYQQHVSARRAVSDRPPLHSPGAVLRRYQYLRCGRGRGHSTPPRARKCARARLPCRH